MKQLFTLLSVLLISLSACKAKEGTPPAKEPAKEPAVSPEAKPDAGAGNADKPPHIT